MNNVRRAAAPAFALSLVLLPTVFLETASAVVLQCGSVVSQSTTLDADVGPCPGTAIFVRGSNVILNLNGRKVFGTGASGEGPGIHLQGATGSQVMNGTVTGFDTGVYIEAGGSNTVQYIRAIDNIGNPRGIGIFGEGIQIYQSDNNVLTHNQVIHNGTFAGIDVFDSSGTRITFNLVSGNNVAQTNSQGGPGIMADIGILIARIDRPTANNVISDNQVSGNGFDGISIQASTTDNQVLRNQVTNNGFGQVPTIRDGSGIRVGASSNKNLVQSNGVYNNAADGIAVVNGQSNRILSNQSYGNDRGPNPIVNFDLIDTNASCDNNVWSGNAFGTRNQECIH